MRRAFVAAVLFVLAFSVLTAYQNPVNYIDSVDAIQANLANQKFAEWITANEADVDTNVANIDSNVAEIDTLQLEVDTLRDRTDLLETSKDSVFDVYDAAGGETIAINQEERINFDTETKEDAIYVHGADACGVEITTAGWYRVNYDVSVKNSGGTVVVVAYAYLKQYNASWANVSGTHSYCELQASVNSAQSMSATKRLELAAGDSLCLTIFNSSATDAIETIANTVRLGIEKLH